LSFLRRDLASPAIKDSVKEQASESRFPSETDAQAAAKSRVKKWDYR
jgi:hypothetical protein